MNKKEIKNRQQQNEFIAMIQRCMDQFNQADKLYDEIEDFIENKMPVETSAYDSEQQDYLHIFEDYDLTDNQLVSIGKAIINNRDNRRNWHNIYEISKVWKEHKQKIFNRNTRIWLNENLKKVINNLNCQWKYRSLSEEDISNLLKDDENKNTNSSEEKQKRHKRYTQKEIENILNLKKEGLKTKDICEKCNIKPVTFYAIIKKYTKE